MYSTEFSAFDNHDFNDQVLLLFDCNNCFKTVQNKSMNQHRASDCEIWRRQHIELNKKLRTILQDKESLLDF